jgi:hypothetical protein
MPAQPVSSFVGEAEELPASRLRLGQRTENPRHADVPC